jgi:formiminotetrahydrofolate cyclodeaminase
VKALGFELKERGIVQVSMNMVNYEGTPLFRAFELIKREAERYGVPVLGSEIVGLVPQPALSAVADFYLQLENFNEDQILERRLDKAIAESESGEKALSESVGDFEERVAAGTPTPGGGSVAAYCAALSAALGRLMCNITAGKPKYAEAEPRVKEINAKLEQFESSVRKLIDEDAASFDSVLQAYRLPKETEGQQRDRQDAIQQAYRRAINAPLQIAETAVGILRLLGELCGVANQNALPDVAVGGRLGVLAVRGAFYNIGVNLPSVTDESWRETVRRKVLELMRESEELGRQVEAPLLAKLGWGSLEGD